jgi:hypothetical protein
MGNNAANSGIDDHAIANAAPAQGPNASDMWVGEVRIDLNDPIDPPFPTAPLIIGGSIGSSNAATHGTPTPQHSPVLAGSSTDSPLIVSSDDDSAPPSQRAMPPSAYSWSGPYSLPLPQLVGHDELAMREPPTDARELRHVTSF